MKQVFFRFLGILFCLTILCGVIPSASAANVDKMDAYKAYHSYLTAEIAGIGSAVRDEDYYEMYTDEIRRPAKMKKILAAYLVDVTNDGIEELIIKRYVTHSSSAVIDGGSMEWVCIYSYIDGEIKRIGQNGSWIRSAGNGSWSYYEPEGYIGSILSFRDHPYISDECVRLYWARDGKVFLCDGDASNRGEGSFSFYSFNGTVMEEHAGFCINWVPNWIVGAVHSNYGYLLYDVNNERVSDKEYFSALDYYVENGTYELRNNDYNEVLNILNALIQGQNVPYGDANPHCHIPSAEWTSANGQHYRTCQSGCDVKMDLADCSGGTASCMQKAKCTVCQQLYGSLADHSRSSKYSFADGKHFFKCTTPGCAKTFSMNECTDRNADHKCDVCGAYVGVHKAAVGTHTCNHCNQPVSTCEDSNQDHKCDICEAYVGVHKAAAGTHTCNHCNQLVSTCEDSNQDHKCDICEAHVGVHEAVAGTHLCDYCNRAVTDCADSNADNKCDTCGNQYPPASENNAEKPQSSSGVNVGMVIAGIVLLAIGAMVILNKRKTK